MASAPQGQKCLLLDIMHNRPNLIGVNFALKAAKAEMACKFVPPGIYAQPNVCFDCKLPEDWR